MKQQPKRNERSRPSAQHAMELHQDNPSQEKRRFAQVDRKSTRLNSSHGYNSYAALCLKKKENDVLLPSSAQRCPPRIRRIQILRGAVARLRAKPLCHVAIMARGVPEVSIVILTMNVDC